MFADLFQRLERDEHLRELDMLFCGPNIAWRLHDTLHSFPHHHAATEDGEHVNAITSTTNEYGGERNGEGQRQSSTAPDLTRRRGYPPPSSSAAGPLVIKFRYNSGLYHDVSGLFPAPDTLFLFNAGLWGYDDWEPTLEHVLGCGKEDANRPSVVVTSYCPEEASDDMETILRVVSADNNSLEEETAVVGGLEWLWRPEVNPHRSLVPRQTQCGVEGRVLFENQSWQALRRSRSRGAPPRAAPET